VADEPPPRVDVGRLAGEPLLAELLAAAAAAHGSGLVVCGPGGAALAGFGATSGDGLPTRAEAERRAGSCTRAVEVYDETCATVTAFAAGHGSADAEAAAGLAAGILTSVATREYETESLSKSLLDVFEEVNLFYGITARIHAVSSVEGICTTILDRACEIVRVARASILLADPRTGVLRIVASRGMSAEQVARVRVQPGEGVTGRVMATAQAVLVDDVGNLDGAKRTADDRYASRSFISVPLRVFDPEEATHPGRPSSHRPLGVLNMTDKSGGGHFTSGDLKLLSALASQAAVLLENTRLSGIEKEMGIARRIQASLLPAAPPRVPGAEISGICVPARNVGGDYYDMVALPGGRAGLLIADVSGHNVGAALMMAVSRASLRAEIRRDGPPHEIMAAANALLADDLARSELFVSVFYAVFDPADGTLAFSNAGHNLPLLLRAGGEEVESLDAEGILLGVVESYPFEKRTVTLREGDLLLMYTDGFTEAADASGEMYGERRLAGALASVRDLPVEEIPKALLAAVDHFSADASADDRTAVVLRAGRMPRTASGAAPRREG